jgi:spore germination protein KA
MNILQNIKNFFNNIFSEEHNYDFTISKEQQSNNQPEDLLKKQEIYPSIDVNLEYIHARYNSLINSDIKIRDFTLNARGKQYKAFLLYIDGLVDTNSINDFILTPLMLKSYSNQDNSPQIISEAITNNISVRKIKKFNITDYIYECLLPQNSIKKLSSFDDLVRNVNSGDCALFVDTINFAFDIDIKKFSQRSISEPKNEPSVRGSGEAFVENLRTNTSMIRRSINNENLIIENIVVGKSNQNNCAVCYIKDIANSSLVAEAKYRLNNIDVDYILSCSELEQLLKDNPETTLPEILSTERVDKTCSHLLQGRVVIIYNGSPYALILPVTLFDFISSPEDVNLNYHFSNLLKFIRGIAFFITLLLPGLYLAITIYHRELIPTELLYSIVATRVNVPFPIILEVLMMELSFELIREAGLRVPSPLGSTVGIVGALVLGEAAVSANIVSPILIIVIAITAISSFAIPDFSISFHLRISRFAYTILGSLCGFLGIGIGLFIHILTLNSLKSFGVPYLSPYAPLTPIGNSSYFLKPVWKREKRASFLNTKKPSTQEKISMKWREK